MSKLLFISSEAFPLVKTGGLADVAGALPTALLKKGLDIRLLLPAYGGIINSIKNARTIASTRYYNLTVNIIETRLPGTQLKTWLVECPALYDRPGGPYSDENGHAWHDNALRFSVLCHAAVDIAMNQLQLDWQADIVHCNDWQTGLVPALLSLWDNRPATVFTIHNLAYQGLFDGQSFTDLQLPSELWNMNGLEYYDQLSFIKGGLAYADKITTVSPSYAEEICTPEHGYGLEGLLNYRKADLVGILNGIDTRYWNPGTDKYLRQKYNRRTLENKLENKTALQSQQDLPVDPDIPMIGMISRLVEQKGLDVILKSLPGLMKLPLQIVILGTGDTHYELQLTEWAQRYPDRISVIIGYSESLAHKIEAASDIYMMPSRFEPCGLNQLYSLRYGSLPVVNAVGGLADTVINTPETELSLNQLKALKCNGFMLAEHSADELTTKIQYVIELYRDRKRWLQLQHNAMSCDFSWQCSADNYLELYQELLAAPEPG